MQIQNIPTTDSPNHDAFEAIVETYYQTQGYITSSGKWFWVWESGKKQRGYQDIDVLAINGNETIIISVSSNLDDKINTQKQSANIEKLEKLIGHFNRIKKYLDSVEQYNWLTKERNIRYVVAYASTSKKTLPLITTTLKENGINLLSTQEIMIFLHEHVRQSHLKFQNQLLRTIQLSPDQNSPSPSELSVAPLEESENSIKNLE